MAITVNLDGSIATIDNGKWSIDKSQDMDEMLEETLNVSLASNLVHKRYGTIWQRDVNY